MDPQQQPPQRPRPQAPYISDFVSQPRPRQATSVPAMPPQPQQPRPPMPIQPSAPTVAGAPFIRGDIAPPQTPQASRPQPTILQPAPQTAARPLIPGAAIPTASAAPAASAPAATSSFQLDEPEEVLPRETKIVKPHQGMRDALSVVGVLASALLLAFCLITFVFQSYQVDGPSMQTTLHNSDHLIVWKVPKTLAKLAGKHYIPKRGDIIIFDEPTSATNGVNKQLIKRVMGLPGDRVVVKDGTLTIYNQQYPNGYSPDKEMAYGKVIVTTPGNVDVTLGDNQIFACGDNRTNSLDSRFFGPIDSDAIVGKLVLRVLPLNAVTRF